jgi:hypothetical protein
MAARARRNGQNNRLEEALAHLLQTQAAFNQILAQQTQNQAAFVQTQAAFNQTLAQQNQNQAAILNRLAELEHQTAERFARVERILLEHTRLLQEHSRILQEHSRMLEALPEAIRQKIGFQPANP